MKTEFIPYELALELKELGFDEPCFTSYLNRKLQTSQSEMFWFQHNYRSHPAQEFISAPLYQQAFRWFIEKYQIVFCYKPCLKKDLTYIFFIYVETTGEKVFVLESKYNEEAELACLNKLIEIVKNK